MSWGFQFAAKTKDVAKSKIDEAVQPGCLPAEIATIMKRQIDNLPDPIDPNGILVESNGHIDNSSGYGSQNSNMTSRITLIPLLAILLALVVPLGAKAQTVDPSAVATVSVVTTPSNPMTFDLGTSLGLSLHLNASIAGYGYDFTHKASIGQINVGGLYVLTSKKLGEAGIGLGGTLALGTGSNSTATGIAGTVDGAIVSPKIDRYRLAAIIRRSFGPVAAWIGVLAPTVEF